MDPRRDLTLFLPTSVKEMQLLGWDRPDVILFSGDAYVDHPSFGAAVIGRTLLAAGFKTAIIPQPNWRDDLRDFRKMGPPRLFFGVSPGAMDSMVNHYTAARRLRSDDAYTPGGRHGARPDYPSIVYSSILRRLFPSVPIILGGIEASLRRLSHYDYWQDRLRPSILADAPADLLIYGMGEKTILEIARALDSGAPIASLTDIRQTALIRPASDLPAPSPANIILNSYPACIADRKLQSANFRHIEQQSNSLSGGATLWQSLDDSRVVKVNPMHPPLTTQEVDATFDLPYTRLPHPRYFGKTIPAYEMIRHSICLHRGCFGGCAFCTISAHQGKFIASRSKESIMREARAVTAMPDFKGYISDLGGPSANMYSLGGKDKAICAKCLRPSCLHPSPCPNLDTDHSRLLDIYRSVDSLPEVKKAFVGSGVRYDLSMHPTGNRRIDDINRAYNEQLITRHVSGRLKVAPEHTCPRVLKLMRKPSFELFHRFKALFDDVNRRAGLRQQLIPYFISSHPGCTEEDMALLAVETKGLEMHLEQIQDFTPTPMTVATEIYYSGVHPYTLEPVYTATTPEEKLAQRQYFFWYDKAYRPSILRSLHRIHRPDLIKALFGHTDISNSHHNTSKCNTSSTSHPSQWQQQHRSPSPHAPATQQRPRKKRR
ncbi:MAG: YgiQ family radical SAM protein [Pseudoflavonifractor sp.]|nr:YgiQ family radical SAM protein [Alloprevotella sp.]MCM1117676.1 YgiQ family radical SAM protein [Pseudoflavonifractor sp.]